MSQLRIYARTCAIALSLILFSCGEKRESLAQAYEPFFGIGAAVDVRHLTEDREILEQHFNRLTAENVMKAGYIEAVQGKFSWEDADAIADFARENGMKMTGHALLWHRETPQWFFADLQAGNKKDIEVLKQRLRDYIFIVVSRYADVVDNWDVVNEVISDSSDKQWRNGKEGSSWYSFFGNEEYIYWAYKYAYDALEEYSKGGAKLYYNDYNSDQKIDKILKMALWLRDEKGIPLDGIGMQAHWDMYGPSIEVISATMQKIIDAGFTVKISELDISIYADYKNGSYAPEREKDYTDEIDRILAQRYKEIFTLFREKAEHISSVSFWGISDDRSWLLNFPVRGRLNYPLLFDFSHKEKKALSAILEF